MDKLTASLEIIKFVAKNESFEQLNISQKTKEILDNFRDIYYNQISEEVTEIDIVELNLIRTDPENKDKNSGGKDDTFHSSTKSELLSTDVIITGRLGAATASKSGGSTDPGSKKTGGKFDILDSSSKFEILSTDVIITGTLLNGGDGGGFSTGSKGGSKLTITGSLSLPEVETKSGGELVGSEFLLPTDVIIPELRITDVIIIENKGGGSTLTGGRDQPPLQ